VKDNVHVQGHAPAFGSGSREPAASADDELVSRLRAAGMVVLGVTQLPELALWGVTESRWHGVTRNPWRLDRAPGGSSGGSAAAVAAGLVPAAHATDGLGSIRIPASSCGLVGLKPTHGLLPLGPWPDHWQGLSHAGLLTRSVLDTALLLDAVLGGGYAAAIGAVPRLRIASSTDLPPPWKPDPAVQSRFDAATRELAALGHELVARKPPYGSSLVNANSVRYLRGVAEDVAQLAEPSRIEPRTRTLAWIGRRLPVRTVRWARAEGQRAREQVSAMFEGVEGVDLLVTPTVPRLPVPAGRLQERGLLATLRTMLPYAGYTQAWNGTGLPALSLPTGMSREGLPVGVQLVGPAGSEATLLALGAQLEARLGWTDRRPEMSELN